MPRTCMPWANSNRQRSNPLRPRHLHKKQLEMFLWSYSDRKILSGVRLSEADGYGRMDLFLRNGK